MSNDFRLSPGESKLVEAVMDAFSERAKFPISLDYLIQRWRDFITEIELGYKTNIFEYTNDLGVRDLLEELLGQIPKSLRNRLVGVLQPWDARFTEATRETQEPLLPPLTKVKKHSWWYRVPRQLKVDEQDAFYWIPYYDNDNDTP